VLCLTCSHATLHALTLLSLYQHHRLQAHVFVGTWNVNAKGKEESLEEWICADWGPNGEQAPDIVAVGFQEIVDLNAVNVAVDNKTQQRSQFWLERLLQTLNNPRQGSSKHEYVLIMQRSLVGLLICVFVKSVHRSRVQYVQSASVGVGVMGMMGNKGGVSVRLQFYDSTLCFVCSHLAAHRENVTGRNADFANVYAKTTFEIGEEAIREVIRSGSLSHWVIGSSAVGIADHDIVVWLGDLNYRIDEQMSTERALFLSEKEELAELRNLDQLNQERAAGRVFEDFEEGRLDFPPTYKYQPGTDVYEQRPDKKLRAPAWCDRILWCAQDPEHVQQMTYGRSERPNISDHKAVYSTLKVTIKDVVQAKREAIYDKLMKLLDRYENQTLPIAGLDRSNLDFGEIRYGQSLTLPIKIANTGSVVVQFRLVPKLDEVSECVCLYVRMYDVKRSVMICTHWVISFLSHLFVLCHCTV
jgi:inositol polyphosphate 5-phosphatase INPP5B/F